MMNKTEERAFAELRHELAMSKALRWPDYQPRQLDVSSEANALVTANVVQAFWFNAHTGKVGRGCFNSVNHSTWSETKTTTQGAGGPWFSTNRDALMALRIEMTRDFADQLAKIDACISEEEEV